MAKLIRRLLGNVGALACVGALALSHAVYTASRTDFEIVEDRVGRSCREEVMTAASRTGIDYYFDYDGDLKIDRMLTRAGGRITELVDVPPSWGLEYLKCMARHPRLFFAQGFLAEYGNAHPPALPAHGDARHGF